ncbi:MULTISPECIES: tellurite resistance TerB family protein [Pseudovibrio]|uniref:tellurite resistance TerB family protein n=1 Tax=Stappiaceae TaxID=2821832 RepID=UPI002365973C|nr:MULTISPECIES: tellurite resistance TerB family protein [Pseudovibrio]MDD7911711.1 tellurite resistance TerB family protein [Pseudovibrio exalbescens]MDX5594839.1 tellurite resistance TerB family protein [Pseudovibrio sp. SPO723]
MFDPKQLVDQFLGSGALGGGQNAQSGGAGGAMQQGQNYLKNNAGGLAGGALAGGLAGLLLGSKKGRKLGKKAVTYGGLALVGGLAYKAYTNWQSNQGTSQGGPAPTPPSAGPSSAGNAAALPDLSGTSFEPAAAPGGENQMALNVLIAMIQAAKADGHVDAQEQAHIFEQIDRLGLGMEEKAFIMDELRAPLDIDKVVNAATTPELAMELYTASRLTIEPDHPAEQAYLQMLAARLGLEPALTAELEKAVVEAQS